MSNTKISNPRMSKLKISNPRMSNPNPKMSKSIIVTDSACNLSKDIQQRHKHLNHIYL